MTPDEEAVSARLHARLRQPASPSTVLGSLPVLFFGDLFAARIATVGLNPSRQEYLDGQGQELSGPKRRFQTLGSLAAGARAELTPTQCDSAITTMRGYFDPGRPVYSWFSGLSRIVAGMGFRYDCREATHLDLVQEATDPTWSRLLGERSQEAATLLAQDAPFLRWQLEAFPLQAIVCNGRTPLDRMMHLLGFQPLATGPVNGRRQWTIAIGDLASRQVAIVGWNIPLAQAPGLRREE